MLGRAGIIADGPGAGCAGGCARRQYALGAGGDFCRGAVSYVPQLYFGHSGSLGACRGRLRISRARTWENWTRAGPIKLSSSNVIDACVFRSPDGLWRLWYKDEGQGSSTWSATSSDLFEWTIEGLVLPGSPDAPPHEGPNVFALSGYYWLIVDECVGRRCIARTIRRAGRDRGLLPGSRERTRWTGGLRGMPMWWSWGTWAVMYYFTHPEWDEASQTAGAARCRGAQDRGASGDIARGGWGVGV
jgi:hypothetical protein